MFHDATQWIHEMHENTTVTGEVQSEKAEGRCTAKFKIMILFIVLWFSFCTYKFIY